MVVFSALLNLVISVIYKIIIYYVGRMLSKAQQLRIFMGFKEESEHRFPNTIYALEKIGQLLMIVAIISAFYEITTTLYLIGSQS